MSSSTLVAPANAASGCQARGRRRPFVAAAASSSGSSSAQAADEPSRLQRRQLLSLSVLAPAAAAVLLGGAPAPACAAEGEAAVAAVAPAAPAAPAATIYSDAEDKFSIAVPAGWAQGTGAIGEAGALTTNQARFSNAAGLRRVVAFFPEGKPDVSVAITVQFISADYTKLGSFGTALDFASGVINKMDNSYILRLPEWRRAKEGPVQVATLLDAKEVNKQYVFSYTLAKEGEPQRTVYSALAMGNNGRYNRLYTLNATCTAADLAQYGPVLQSMVSSFQPPALPY